MASSLSNSAIFPKNNVLKYFDVIDFFKINMRSFFVLVFIAVLGFIAFYVFQLHKVTIYSSLISSYENQINQISEENKLLEIALSQYNLPKDLTEIAQELNFEKIDKIKYLQIGETKMAEK